MTSDIHFDEFMLAFEHGLERINTYVSNSPTPGAGTSGLNHSEIETAIKELGAVLDAHLPSQIAAISGGEVSLTPEQVDRLKDNLKQLEKLEIMAQSRLTWVNSLGNEMADWVDKLDAPRKD